MRLKKNFGALFSLILVPFGPVEKLVSRQNPWSGFHASDKKAADLLVVRAEKIASGRCDSWLKATLSLSSALFGPVATEKSWAQVWESWKPWEEKDLDAIRQCGKSPCKVKMSPGEGAEMGKIPESSREGKYLELILARVKSYEKSQHREASDYPDTPTDPWLYFKKMGLVTTLKSPKDSEIYSRKLEFGREKDLHPIHQILDRRIACAADKKEAIVWLRDVYSDHYFDSWGEWISTTCLVDGSVQVVQALFVEFDQLKKGDLFSRMLRGKMRSTIEEQGKVFLNKEMARIREKVLN